MALGRSRGARREWGAVGGWDHHAQYQYSLSFIIIITHDLSPVMHFIKHSRPSYDVMVAIYIRPNHLSFLQHCN